MAHWEDRPEPAWREFGFEQPYKAGLERLRREVLVEGTDYDPAVLWQWGTMQAMAVIEILRGCERTWGAEGQQVVYGALRRVGRDVGRQVLAGFQRPEGVSDAELLSFYATVMNRIAYASLEEPTIDSDDKVSFHIVWCPHQDHYRAFDCRVQRYFVQGMIEALQEVAADAAWEVRFTRTIPAGAETCHFEIWRADRDAETPSAWERYTEELEARALERSRREAPED